MSRCKVVAIANQKGGTGKTTTAASLGVALAMSGKRVLLIDADPQGDLTASLGWRNPDELETTLATHLEAVARDEPVAWATSGAGLPRAEPLEPDAGILKHPEGVDLMPANIELSGTEVALVTAMNRERTLKAWLDEAKRGYDYALIDCMPSLGMLAVNALAAADSVIVPVQAQYLPAKGMTQLVKTIGRVKRQINPHLEIEGVLLTLVDGRTNLAKQIEASLREGYGKTLRVFGATVPLAVRAAETSAYGKSIFQHDAKSPVAAAYAKLAEEVLEDAQRKRDTHRPAVAR